MKFTTEQYLAERQMILTRLQNLEEQVACQEILSTLKNLETAAEETAAMIDGKAKQTELQLETIQNQINDSYLEKIQLEAVRGNLEFAYTKLVEQLKQKEIWLSNYENFLSTLRTQLDHARERERNIQKQFWIPINQPLTACRMEVDKLNQNVKEQSNKISELRQEIQMQETEKQRINETCWQNRQMIKMMDDQIYHLNGEQETLLAEQKELLEARLQWQTQNLYFRNLQEKLSGCQSMAEMTEEAKAEIKQLVSQAPQI